MKILRVKLNNLNSLRGAHEVDFEAGPLAGAGLFVITGPTGAGKSTLLDAITLALYGRAARYGTMPSPEDMMSRQCGECSAEVVFRVPSGAHASTYRAEWQLRRARGKPDGKVQPARRHVYDAAGQPLTQKVHEAEELIAKLVGLDYPRFMRSALLAQGEFAQFLKAPPSERAELLESLTDTFIYSELGRLAHEETGRRESELSRKEAGIQQIQLLPDEERQKLAGDFQRNQLALVGVKKSLEEVAGLLAKADNLARALKQENQAVTGRDKLASDRQAAKSALQGLVRHRLTIPFSGDLAKLDTVEQEVGKARKLQQKVQGDHASALRKAQRCLQGYRRLVTDQFEATRKDIQGCADRIGSAAKRKTNADKWLAEHQSDRELRARLPNLVAELTGLKSARKNLKQEWTRLRKAAAQLDPGEAENLPPEGDSLDAARAAEIPGCLAELAERKLIQALATRKQAGDELQRRKDNLERARLAASLEQHRHNLKPGEPCPLCGATEHPFTQGAAPSFPFQDLEQLVAEAEKDCQVRDQALHELKRLQAELPEHGENLRKAAGERDEALDLLRKNLEGIARDVPAAGKEDETRAELQQRDAAYSRQAAEAAKAEQDRLAAEGDQKRFETSLASLQEKQAALNAESFPEPPEAAAEAGPDAAELHWSSVAEAEKAWMAVKSELTAGKAVLETQRRNHERLEDELSRLKLEVSGKLSGSAFAGIDDLIAARLDPAEAARVEKLESDLKDRGQQLETELRLARAAIEKLRQEAAPEGGDIAGVRSRQATLQSDHDKLIQALTTGENQLKQDDANRKVVAGRQKELEADRQQLDVWRRLHALIGSHDGRKFRTYAQGISLDVLVHCANRHLERLSDRYRLRRKQQEELDLEIEDAHQAGAVRPMASLSGGESFLASLALALGLSDIAGRNVRIESLFVDEGFGSLDSDTLDLAISALETLRQDDKTVGVISHVELLKERIAAQVIVEKQSGGVSSLRLVSQ